MASSLFNDLQLSAAQLNSNYHLQKINEAGLQLDDLNPRVDDLDAAVENIQGANANNQILIGDAITNVPAVANIIIIGDGDKANTRANDVLIGNGATASANVNAAAGTLYIGNNMAAVINGAPAAANFGIPIFYNGVRYLIHVVASPLP